MPEEKRAMSQANTQPRIENETFDAASTTTDWRKLARLFAIGVAAGLGAALVAHLVF